MDIKNIKERRESELIKKIHRFIDSTEFHFLKIHTLLSFFYKGENFIEFDIMDGKIEVSLLFYDNVEKIKTLFESSFNYVFIVDDMFKPCEINNVYDVIIHEKTTLNEIFLKYYGTELHKI